MDLSDGAGIQLATLNHMLAVAQNDAANALRESTQALVAWGDAMAAFRAGTGPVQHAVEAEHRFKLALRARRDADDALADLQRLALVQG